MKKKKNLSLIVLIYSNSISILIFNIRELMIPKIPFFLKKKITDINKKATNSNSTVLAQADKIQNTHLLKLNKQCEKRKIKRINIRYKAYPNEKTWRTHAYHCLAALPQLPFPMIISTQNKQEPKNQKRKKQQETHWRD